MDVPILAWSWVSRNKYNSIKFWMMFCIRDQKNRWLSHSSHNISCSHYRCSNLDRMDYQIKKFTQGLHTSLSLNFKSFIRSQTVINKMSKNCIFTLKWIRTSVLLPFYNRMVETKTNKWRHHFNRTVSEGGQSRAIYTLMSKTDYYDFV